MGLHCNIKHMLNVSRKLLESHPTSYIIITVIYHQLCNTCLASTWTDVVVVIIQVTGYPRTVRLGGFLTQCELHGNIFMKYWISQTKYIFSHGYYWMSSNSVVNHIVSGTCPYFSLQFVYISQKEQVLSHTLASTLQVCPSSELHYYIIIKAQHK